MRKHPIPEDRPRSIGRSQETPLPRPPGLPPDGRTDDSAGTGRSVPNPTSIDPIEAYNALVKALRVADFAAAKRARASLRAAGFSVIPTAAVWRQRGGGR
jgi:hypothetical protein